MSLLQHPSLGKLQGVPGVGVVQYFNCKYASLKNRLSQAELHDGNGPDIQVDATKIGPTAPMAPTACDMEFLFIQHTLPKPAMPYSDTDCLNLNITVPSTELTSAKSLPVFVFIHGGGFGVGSGSWPQYDLARFVKLSGDKGMPVIGITINYRLGVGGFLTSEELRKHGYAANNGLRDQKVALRWIKKHIGGFGGDGNNITVVGESAGGASCTFHLQSDEALFQRLISVGGTSLLMKPVPPPVTEFAYNAVLQALGISDLHEEERIKQLLEIPMADVIANVGPNIPLIPSVDGDILKHQITFKDLHSKDATSRIPGRTWCKDLVIGNCETDASIFSFMLHARKAGSGKAFAALLKKHLPGTADSILEAYEIREDSPDDEAFQRILEYCQDVSFQAPTLAFAETWPGRAFVYYFDEPNPWEGEWKGKSTHILDVAYLFLNFNEFLSSEQQAVAHRFAEDFIAFTSGKSPWAEYEESSKRVKIYGPSDQQVERITDGSIGRRQTMFKWADEVGLDGLSGIWDAFLTGQ